MAGCGGQWRGRLRPSRSALASATACRRRAILFSGDGGEAAAADAVLYRVFLKDGGVLVSYGEFASVADQGRPLDPDWRHRRQPGAPRDFDRRKRRRVAAHQRLRAGGAGAALRRHPGRVRLRAPDPRSGRHALPGRLDRRCRPSGWRWPRARGSSWSNGRNTISAIAATSSSR